MLDQVVYERVDPARSGVTENLEGQAGQIRRGDHARAHRVVDVVIDIGHPIHETDDLALERRRLGSPTGMTHDPVENGPVEVETPPVAFQDIDDSQRLLVMAKGGAESLGQATSERVLADVAERRMAQVVAEPDRLDQVLVQA